MGNLGGMEVLVIFLVALIVLGPTKLPEAARQVGKAVNELRRISGGFQREMREALQEPLAEEQARDRGRSLAADQKAARAAGKNPYAKPDDEVGDEAAGDHPSGDADPAEAAPIDGPPSSDDTAGADDPVDGESA